jgi:hypothetical protein
MDYVPIAAYAWMQGCRAPSPGAIHHSTNKHPGGLGGSTVSKHQHVLQPHAEADQEFVAAAAAKILADAESALADLRANVEQAAGEAPANPAARTLSEDGADRPLAEMDARLDADRATIAAIRSDLSRVHFQLDQITAGIVALQTHSLRQTGGVALALSVVIAIGWKVIAG